MVFARIGNQGKDQFFENVQEFFGSYHAMLSGFSGKTAGKERLAAGDVDLICAGEIVQHRRRSSTSIFSCSVSNPG